MQHSACAEASMSCGTCLCAQLLCGSYRPILAAAVGHNEL